MKKDSFGEKVQDFMSGEKEYITVHQELVEGFMDLTFYTVFPGIYLAYNDIHAQTVPSNKDGVVQNLLLLNYCIKGRCEFKMDEYNYSYLEHHRMNIALQVPQDNFYYPSGRYKGYEIYLFPQMLAKETTDFLKALGIEIDSLIENYTKYRVFYTSEIIEKLWSRIEESCHSKNTGQIRLDLLQILKYFCDDKPSPSMTTTYLSKAQSMLAKKAREMLVQDLSRHLSMREIAERLEVSETSLKRYFRAVYGKNISVYMKEIRMQKAANLLTASKQSISDIAKACGYVNQGRFASVFGEYYGVKPLEYRRMEKQKE